MYMCEYENFAILRNSYTFQWDRNKLYKISRKLLLSRKNSIRLRSFLASRATDTWRSRIFSIRQFIEKIHEGEQWYPVKFNERLAHYIRILARLTPSPPRLLLSSSSSYVSSLLSPCALPLLNVVLVYLYQFYTARARIPSCDPYLDEDTKKLLLWYIFVRYTLFLTIRMNANVGFNFSSETAVSVEESYKYIIFLGIIEKVTCFCP